MNTKQSPTSEPTSNTEELWKKDVDYILEVLCKPSELDVNRIDEKGYTWREWVHTMFGNIIKEQLTTVIETTRKETAWDILKQLGYTEYNPGGIKRYHMSPEAYNKLKHKYLTEGEGNSDSK